jgi:hypothetical protein
MTRMKKWPKAKQAVVDKIKAADTYRRPESLFVITKSKTSVAGPGHIDQIKEQFREMVRLVHPDANPDIEEASDIMARLNTLYDLAQKKLAENMWGKSKVSITFDKKIHYMITDVEPFSNCNKGTT